MGGKGARRCMGTKGAQRKILSTLRPNTILKPNRNLMPTPTLSLVLAVHLPLPLALTATLTRIEYLDRVGGGRNIV